MTEKYLGSQIELTGLAYWAKLRTDNFDPGYRGGPPSYAVDLILEGDDLELAKEAGLKIYDERVNKETGVQTTPGNAVRLKSHCDKQPEGIPAWDCGTSERDPQLIQNPPFLGNGSKITAKIYISQGGEGFNRGNINSYQIIDLITFEQKGSFSTKEGGYVSDGNEEPVKAAPKAPGDAPNDALPF